MSNTKKWRKLFHKRYIAWLFWHNICKLSSVIRKKANFYEDFTLSKNCAVKTYREETEKYALKDMGLEFTKEEKDFIKLVLQRELEPISEFIIHNLAIYKIQNILLIGNTGSLIQDKKIILSEIKTDIEDKSYNKVKANFTKPIKKQEDELFFSMVGTKKGNQHFYHFFIDFFPLVFYLIDTFENKPITIIVNTNITSYQKFAYDYVTKKYHNIKIVEMPENDIWEIPNLVYIANTKNVWNSFVDMKYVGFLREIFVKGQEIEIQENTKGNRYYISRNDTKNRNVINEDELLPILEEYGFKVIYPTEHPLKEQIEMFANAEAIVAPAGAAFTNLLYARPETKIVGFYPSDLLSSCHMFMCKGVGIKQHKHIISGAREGSRGHYRIPKEQLVNILKDCFYENESE